MTTATDSRAGDVAERIATLRRGLEGIMGVPATEGNSVEVLRNGIEIFPAMLDSIAGAKRTVDLLTFVYWRGEVGRRFAQALSESARAGCACACFSTAGAPCRWRKRCLTRWATRECRSDGSGP